MYIKIMLLSVATIKLYFMFCYVTGINFIICGNRDFVKLQKQDNNLWQLWSMECGTPAGNVRIKKCNISNVLARKMGL